MRPLKLFITAVVALCCFSTSFADMDAEWDLKIDKGDISVYSRSLKDSSIYELRALTRTRSSVAAIITLLNDVEAASKWIPYSSGAIILKRISKSESVIYGIINPPWPASDRDIIVHFFLTQDPDTLSATLTIKGEPTYIPLVNGYVRIQVLNAYWKITPVQDGFVDVVYQVHAEPGGLVPSWFVNASAANVVYNTVKNLKKIIQEDKYKRAELDEVLTACPAL